MYFLCKLIPPRPTFPADMSAAEKQAMQKHVAYWMTHLERGKLIAFGPVADPAGAWGLALLCVDDEAELEALLADDPAIRAGVGMRYERLAMPRLVHKTTPPP